MCYAARGLSGSSVDRFDMTIIFKEHETILSSHGAEFCPRPLHLQAQPVNPYTITVL